MNKAEIIRVMGGGGQLDNLVANKVFGIETYSKQPGAHFEVETDLAIKEYSQGISVAFQVVEKMQEDGFSLELIIGADGYTMALFWGLAEEGTKRENEVLCESVPEAICKAALLINSGKENL